MVKVKKLLFISFFFSFSSSAGLYMDTGLGLTWIRGAAPLYLDGAGEVTKYSLGAMGGFGLNVFSDAALFQVHLVVRGTVYDSKTPGEHVGIFAPMAMLRFEVPTFYLDVGGTNALFSGQTSGGYGGYTRLKGGIGFGANFAYIWRVTPDFFNSIEVGGIVGRSDKGIAPKPAAHLMVVLRFYFDKNRAERRRHGDWDGWRYPYGVDTWDR